MVRRWDKNRGHQRDDASSAAAARAAADFKLAEAQVKRVVGNERTAQSRQAVELREAAGTDENGRARPVTVTDSRGQKKTLDGDWHTPAQAGRTSESVTPAPTSTQHTHSVTHAHAQSQQLG